MTNFEGAQRAVTLAINSAGSATKENEAYMDSMSAKLNLLKAQFQELVLGEGGLQNVAKWFLDIGIAILKFANSDVGQVVIKLTALITTLNLVKNGFVALKETTKVLELTRLIKDVVALKSGMATVASSELAMTVATEGLTKAFIANATAWAATPMGMATIVVASIGAIVAMCYKLVTAVDESTEAYKRNVEELKNAKQEYDDLSNSVESIKSQLESIRQQKLEITDENQLNLLREEEASLERQLKIAEAKAEAVRQEAEEKAKALLNENVEFVTPQGEGGYSETVETTRVKAVELYIESLKELKRQQEENEIQMAKYAEEQGVESKEYKRAEENAKSLQEQINLFSNGLTSLLETLQLQREALTSTDAETQALKETTDEMIDAGLAALGMTDDSKEALEGLGELLSQLTEEQQEELDMLLEKYPQLSEHLQEIVDRMIETGCSAEEAAEQLDYITDNASEAVSATERLSEATSELNSALDALNGMASAYDTLSNAVNEYNATGQFSLSTLTDLIALGSDYMSLLELENGQMTINEQGLNALANAYIDDAEAKAYDKAMAELEAAAQDESNSAHQAGQSAGSASASGSITAANGAKQAAQAALEGAAAFNQFWTAATKGQYQGKVSTATINSIGSSLNTTLKTLESFRTSVNKNTTATIKSTGATKSGTRATGGSTKATKANTKAVDANTEALKANVDALKKQKEALEDEVKDYETVIDYLNDKVDEEIDKLEELRDSEVQVLEDRIDYYEELADAEDEELKNRIDNLEEARDAEEEYWNAKIDAIKAANDATEDQIELETLLQNLALAKSKKVKVYRQGQGFVYETDQEVVSEAESELNEYYRKKALEDQIASLEKQRDDALNIYNQQIKDLENYRTQVNQKYEDIVSDLKKQVEAIKEKYNDQIQILKDWQDAFEKQTSAYEEEIKRQLTIQMTGIDTEQANWTTRLNNLSAFVSAYNAKLKELDDITAALERAEAAYNSAQSSISSGSSYDSGGGSHSVSGGGSTTPTVQTANYKVLGYEKKFSSSSSAQSYIMGKPARERGKYSWVEHGGAYYVCLRSKIKTYSGITETQASRYAEQYKPLAIYWKYATGVSSVGSDRAALVGDNPKYRELVIGSKLNNDQGTIMSLKRGTGVVNAKSTNTLAGILNSLSGQTSNAKQVSNNSNNGTTITIGSISLPEVKDGKGFVDYLQNFSTDITQLSYART